MAEEAPEAAASGPPQNDSETARPAGEEEQAVGDGGAGLPGRDRDGQFSDPAEDPLADAFGGTFSNKSADQAYRIWVRTVESGGGPATIFGGGSFRDINIGTTVYGRVRDQAPGPIRREALKDLIRRYTPVAGYEALASRLAAAHLLVLRGAPGTGRATTGLHLLAHAAEELRVSRFDPETDLSSLAAEDLEKGSGYLLRLAPAGGAPPSDVQMDRLARLVADGGAFMIVVAPFNLRSRAAFDGYVADCPPPDARLLLRDAVEREARVRSDLAGRLGELAAPMVRPGAVADRMPSEVMMLVQLLVSCASGQIAPQELAHAEGKLLSRCVSEWFEPFGSPQPGFEGDEQVRLAAFQIALAVLNETPFDLVAEAAERLSRLLIAAGTTRKARNRAVFANQREDYVANSRALLRPRAMQFTTATVPSTFAAYADDRMPRAVLARAWDIHSVREPMISWLQALSQDRRPFVWMRAALTIGLLSSWDFAYTFHELIEPWARSSDDPWQERRRLVAAVALDAASRSEPTKAAVEEILDGWRRRGSYHLRLAGTLTLGYDLGLRDPAASMKALLTISRWRDGILSPVASWAIARIFTRGGMQPALGALLAWLSDDRRETRRLAQRTVLRIAGLIVADAEYADPGREAVADRHASGPSRARWPFLIAAAEEDPALRDPLADLVWPVLQSSAARDEMDKIIGRWARACQKDPACTRPTGRFLALLGDTDDDRARLLYLIRKLRGDQDDPLPDQVASSLARMIETNADDGDRETGR